ncbi:MAG: division/cell wall cluster transcriptional repressor MraZ [Erysipelotrichaceae bacterium]|mgnify:FL=1|nr:division/cell wall cluster transcriptional repressor MraZ [Erysipelotrichaceae bacterium]
MLMGEFHHNLDTKGRLILPAKIRENLGEKFIITKGIDKCLFVYPLNEWESIIQKYRELPNTKEARDFMRFFLSGASECEFDRLGRINISEPLLKYASLNRECVIIGVNERLEIWNKDLWDNFVLENEKNFSNIADHLFETNV